MKGVLALFYFLLIGLAFLQRIGERVRAALLAVILSLVYLLVLTPLGLRTRANSRSEVYSWKNQRTRVGWCPNKQSTSDLTIYTRFSSSREDLLTLKKEKTDASSTLRMYDILMPLKFLAKPPKEKELSADLYVMF